MKRRAAAGARHRPRQGRTPHERNYLKGRLTDRINAVLAAAGYNFGLLLRWLAELLPVIVRAFTKPFPRPRLKRCLEPHQFFTDDSVEIERAR
ncbi:hypothetical protein ACVWZ6_009224 [Bradyrhizobium sp. GM6.1]